MSFAASLEVTASSRREREGGSEGERERERILKRVGFMAYYLTPPPPSQIKVKYGVYM